MSRKANPTIIGVFILIGVALGMGAVLFFSSSKLFTKTKEYILYFDGSLTGLDPGTAVKFRGVTIGSVKEVLIHFNQPPADACLPVIIELNLDLLRKRSDEGFQLGNDSELDAYIKRGLRGKLEAQSLLTGLLYIELEFLPKAPAPLYHQLKPLYREIPTAPTEVQIFRVDFAEITSKLNIILSKLDSSLGELQVREINRGLTNLLASLNQLANSPDLAKTLTSAHASLEDFRALSARLQSRIDQLANSTDQTLAQSRETMQEVRRALEDAREMIAPQAPLRQDLHQALRDLGDAARAVADLAAFLNDNPNAVVAGRKGEATKR